MIAKKELYKAQFSMQRFFCFFAWLFFGFVWGFWLLGFFCSFLWCVGFLFGWFVYLFPHLISLTLFWKALESSNPFFFGVVCFFFFHEKIF